ncbi:MAG: hydrolase/aminopeptidase, partial [Acidobacteria bacterium]
NAIARFGAGSPLTRLRMSLEGIDPDDAFSTVPYEKGCRFLALIERTVGRDQFDRFVREYIAQFRFTSITSEAFIDFLDQKFPGVSSAINAKKWLYEPDMPSNAPKFRSVKVEELTALAQSFLQGKRPSPDQIKEWNPSELVVYLQRLPRQLDKQSCDWLDQNLSLTNRGNYEILVEWLVIAAGSDYEPAFARIREVLMRVGRMKYLRPLFMALGLNPRTRALAREVFSSAAPTYHNLSRRVVESVMEKYPQDK